jgi:hypothetical protein
LNLRPHPYQLRQGTAVRTTVFAGCVRPTRPPSCGPPTPSNARCSTPTRRRGPPDSGSAFRATDMVGSGVGLRIPMPGRGSLRAAAAQQLNRTSPREPPRASPAALVQWPATRGFVVGAVVGIPRWHARGQGFKSPQLHQAQRIGSTPAQGRLPEICQSLTDRVGQDTVSADRFR